MGLFAAAGATALLLAQVVVTVTPSSAYVTTGHRKTFTASVSGTTKTGVSWRVVETGGGTVDRYGAYTAPSTLGTYHVRATSTTYTSIYGQSTVMVVAPPDATISAPSSVTAGTAATASVPAVAGSTYQWSIPGATLSGGATGNSVTYVPASSGTLALTCTVQNAAGDAVTGSGSQSVLPAPAIAAFTASKSVATAGSPVQLTPVFSNGTGAINGTAVASGSPVTVAPGATTTYTLTVTNALGAKVSQSVTVSTVAPPSIASFAADKAAVTQGAGANLLASFTGGSGSVQNLGPIVAGAPLSTGALSSTTTYVLTVTNAAGDSTTAQTTVKVVPAPAISAFTAAKDVLSVGKGTTLTASFSGGIGSVDGGIGAVGSGSAVPTGNLSATKTYTLTVTNEAGDTVARTLTVKVVEAPSISAFSAARSVVTAGKGTSLTADFTGGAGVVDQGLGSVSSGLPVATGPITEDRTYTLTVTNEAGDSVSRQVSVGAVAAPQISSFAPAKAVVTTGQGTSLSAVYSGGTGVLDGGLGALGSGQALPTGALAAPSTFTLTVTNAAGDSASQQASVDVVAAPAATGLVAAKDTLSAGRAAVLTPTFTGGTAVLSGLGPVSSGVPATTAALNESTDFVLTVTNAAGDTDSRTLRVTVVPMPAIAAFTAAKGTVTAGKGTTLTASFTGGTAAVDHGMGAVGSGQSVPTAPLDQTTTFTLTVTNAAGDSVTEATSVTVVPAPVIDSFVAAKDPVSIGKAASLTATFSGGTGTVSGLGAVVSGSPLSTGSLAATTDYTLTVTNPAGDTASRTLTVTAVPMPGIASFGAAKSPVSAGKGTTLLAAFSGGTGSVDQGIGSVLPGASVPTGDLPADTTYTLTVTNAAGDSVSQSATVAVVPMPAIAGFTSSLSQIFPGQSTQLTGLFSGGTGVIDPGVGPVASGTAVAVSPAATTEYTLTVTNAAGETATQKLTTTVDTQPLTITRFASSASVVNRGETATLDWSFTGTPSTLTLNGASVLGGPAYQAVTPVRRAAYALAGSNPIGGDSKVLTVAARGLDLLAGSIGGPGNLDGNGRAARFAAPIGAAADASGNLYVADTGNHVIRKVTPAGDVQLFAGQFGTSGSADGVGSAARFYTPSAVAVDAAGNVYVADTNNSTIRRITPDGTVTTFAGLARSSGSADGIGGAARFMYPAGLAFDASGNLYVADTGNYTLRRITAAAAVTTVAGQAGFSGVVDGTGSAARLGSPQGLSVDASGNVIVADTDYSVIRKVTPDGVVSTLAGYGSTSTVGYVDGTGTSARFNRPKAVLVEPSGSILVADTGNHLIRRISAGNQVGTVAGAYSLGNGYADGQGTAARFNSPAGLALLPGGDAVVVDRNNQALRRMTAAAAVSTFAGDPLLTPGIAGPANAATPYLSSPRGTAVDAQGNVYLADSGAHLIRRITPAGALSTFAGTYGASGSTDGVGTVAKFNRPQAVAMDPAGNLYVADTGNHTIRKISPAGAVTTLAGYPGSSGSTDGTGSAARFGAPAGLAVDAQGNVYVADTGNGTLRKVTAAGVVTTLAGYAGSTGSSDGTGAWARFSDPRGVALGPDGNLYVADTTNATLRKVTPTGTVTTLAGSAGSVGTVDGTGASARFNAPMYVAADAQGNLYVTDNGSHLLRRVGPSGGVTTLVGVPGLVGVRLGAFPGALYQPYGVAADVNGDLVVVTSAGVVAVTAP